MGKRKEANMPLNLEEKFEIDLSTGLASGARNSKHGMWCLLFIKLYLKVQLKRTDSQSLHSL